MNNIVSLWEHAAAKNHSQYPLGSDCSIFRKDTEHLIALHKLLANYEQNGFPENVMFLRRRVVAFYIGYYEDDFMPPSGPKPAA